LHNTRTIKKLWRLKCPSSNLRLPFIHCQHLVLCLVQCLIVEWDETLCAVARLRVEDRGTVVRLGHEHEYIIVSKPQGPALGSDQPPIQ
jgi:hypothetical protein